MLGYDTVELSRGAAIVKRARYIREPHIGLIADCDGVLIDSRGSYDKAIQVTVDFFLTIFTGQQVRNRSLFRQMTQSLRDTGLFNNDWDICFAVIAGVLVRLPARWQNRFVEALDDFQFNSDSQKMLEAFRGTSRELLASDVAVAFRKYAGLLKRGDGFRNVDAYVYASDSTEKRTLEAFGKLTKPKGNFLRGVLAPIFDEFYLGSAFFAKIWKRIPHLKARRGLFENEKRIVRLEKARELKTIFRGNLGIASGRNRLVTKASLKQVHRFFNEKASVFLDDEERLARTSAKLGKPNPYSLLKSIKPFPRKGRIFHVGDSAADLEMTRRANLRVRGRFTYIGVCENGIKSPREYALMWQKLGADLIVPTFNQVPDAIRRLSVSE